MVSPDEPTGPDPHQCERARLRSSLRDRAEHSTKGKPRRSWIQPACGCGFAVRCDEVAVAAGRALESGKLLGRGASFLRGEEARSRAGISSREARDRVEEGGGGGRGEVENKPRWEGRSPGWEEEARRRLPRQLQLRTRPPWQVPGLAHQAQVRRDTLENCRAHRSRQLLCGRGTTEGLPSLRRLCRRRSGR